MAKKKISEATKAKLEAKKDAQSPVAPIKEVGAQDEFPLLVKKPALAILGTAPSMPATPWDDKNFEIWGVAQLAAFPAFKRADVLFELHTADYWDDEGVLARLNKWDGRLVMQDHYEKVPASERFPIETIAKYRPYHRTSITYMLAAAYHSFLTIGTPGHVALFGVHMEDIREEYAEQRPCCEYWLGRMEAAGMDIFIASGAILAAPFMYGYEAYNPLNFKFRQRLDGLQKGVQIRANEELEKRLQKHEQIGAVKEIEYWLRLAQRGELNLSTLLKELEEQEPQGVNTTAAAGG